MSPFAVLRIDHIVFRVASLERSIAFYRSVLGCEVAKEQPRLGLVHLRAGNAMIDLISLDGQLGSAGGKGPDTEGKNVDHLCLRIEPFDEDAIRAHLSRRNIRPLGPLAMNFGAEGTGPSLYIEDPDGNVIEIKGASRQDSSDT